ncbi:MAG: acyltransferase, partial [Bdellovibrionota bacterium]
MPAETYRADIDGLRAVAIALVVGGHAFPRLLPSGFIGVDLFFVISGYLITSVILRDRDQGTFSFLKFYAHRFRRLAPAMVVVLLTVWMLGRSILFSDEFENLGVHLMGGGTYTSNFVLWQEAGYFDVDSNLKPLLHLWSLGVEEQFYLVWPAVLIFWISRSWSLALLWALLAFSSFVENIFSPSIEAY